MAKREVRAVNRHASVQFVRLAVGACQFGAQAVGYILEPHAILRTARACNRWKHRGQVKLQQIGENGLRAGRIAPHPLRLRIGLDQRYPPFIPPG